MRAKGSASSSSGRRVQIVTRVFSQRLWSPGGRVRQGVPYEEPCVTSIRNRYLRRSCGKSSVERTGRRRQLGVAVCGLPAGGHGSTSGVAADGQPGGPAEARPARRAPESESSDPSCLCGRVSHSHRSCDSPRLQGWVRSSVRHDRASGLRLWFRRVCSGWALVAGGEQDEPGDDQQGGRVRTGSGAMFAKKEYEPSQIPVRAPTIWMARWRA